MHGTVSTATMPMTAVQSAVAVAMANFAPLVCHQEWHLGLLPGHPLPVTLLGFPTGLEILQRENKGSINCHQSHSG